MSGQPAAPDARDLPDELPLFPLTGVLLLPRGRLPLNVFEPRYLAMVDHALGHGRLIGIIQPDTDGTIGLSAPDGSGLYRTGCAGRITSFQETGDGRYLITLHGVCRFDIAEELPPRSGYRAARADWQPYLADLADGEAVRIDRGRLLGCLRIYFDAQGIEADWDTLEKTPDDRLVTTLAMVCPFDPAEKQALLEAAGLAQRARLLTGLIEAALRGGSDDGTTVLN